LEGFHYSQVIIIYRMSGKSILGALVAIVLLLSSYTLVAGKISSEYTACWDIFFFIGIEQVTGALSEDSNTLLIAVDSPDFEDTIRSTLIFALDVSQQDKITVIANISVGLCSSSITLYEDDLFFHICDPPNFVNDPTTFNLISYNTGILKIEKTLTVPESYGIFQLVPTIFPTKNLIYLVSFLNGNVSLCGLDVGNFTLKSVLVFNTYIKLGGGNSTSK